MLTKQNAIGLSVYGIDVKSATSRQLDDLRDLLYAHRLIILKEQVLEDEAYCDFSRKLMNPVPYLQDNYHHPDFPLIFVSSNVKEAGKQMGVARTGGYWHSDTSFEQDPKVITMLMPKVLPENHPRTTRFIIRGEVLANLPETTRAAIERAELMHSGRWRYKVRQENIGLDIFEILSLIDHYAPPVRHPAIISHPYTGEKLLYANRGFTIAIADRSLDESERVLSEIFDFAEQPRFVKEVRWSIGDIIIWDNRFLQHSSGRNSGPEEATMMFRITGFDAYPLCATMPKRTVADRSLVSTRG
jgi:taurine dioxygenase